VNKVRSPQYLKEILRTHQKSSCSESTDIYLSGSFTLDSLVPYLKAHFLAEEIAANIEVGPYNQVLQFFRQPESYIDKAAPPDVICLIWRIEDVYPRALENALVDGHFHAELKDELDRIIEGVARLREWYKGIIIVSTPPFPQYPGFSTNEVGQGQLGGSIFRNISEYWSEQIAALRQILTFDLQALLLLHGIVMAHDARKWYMYRQPYRENFLAEIAWMVSRTILAQKRSARKCIVLDCDNTLWGGVIGEDGISGIQIGDDFPGRVYRDFQLNLKQLHQRGILLAIASKNNPDDVIAVFDSHDAMVLSKVHIACFEIGWESKVESLRRIANVLNIGTDSLVFIDDSRKEIAEVEQRLPEVICILVPEEIADLPLILNDTGLFDQTQITEEDRNRAGMMRAAQIREHDSTSLSEEEFKRSLAIRLSVFEVEPQHVARATQLVNKTNQFNLTTIRRTQHEIEALVLSKRHRVLAVNVSDKYGDYGLVGVGILEQRDEGIWFIDTLLLSCRVLGRDVETAFISAIANLVSRDGGCMLVGRFIPSLKNVQTEKFYFNHGFKFDPQSGEWHADLSSIIALAQSTALEISIHANQRI
jgi:FkbH-like protein